MEMVITKIHKRNGESVPFNEDRIKNAIMKAFYSQGYFENQEIAKKLTREVVLDINRNFGQNKISSIEEIQNQYSDIEENHQKYPDVEQIQNIVEEKLMLYQYTDVARAYILYRNEHKKLREENNLRLINSRKLKVKQENGETYLFSKDALKNKLVNISDGLKKVDVNALLENICRGLYDGVLQKEIEHLTLKEAESKIEIHYDYSSLASRLLLDGLYKNILQCSFVAKQLESKYRKGFLQYIHVGIENELLSEELKDFDLTKISSAIVAERDLKFHYLGMQTICDRYLLKTRNKNVSLKKIFELPQWLWMRVAMGLAVKEKNKEERAIEFYHVLSRFYLTSSSPTLFNSGTQFMQLSSCYINTVEDSLDGIFKNYSDNAQLSKWAGGIGTDWTRVRASGSAIKGTNGVSTGIIPFIKIFNDVAIAVNQGGKRRGAMAAYLENWHLDIDEFVELKKNTGDERRRAHDIHPAVFISDLFMKRVRSDGDWMLFSPDDTPELHTLYGKDFEEKYLWYEANPPIVHRVIKASDLWRKILTMLYETGHPWITFKDAINVRNPQAHVGMVHSSNLCTEITLNTSLEETAVCNLASLNLSNMITDGRLDRDLLKNTITTGIRMLDNVIDINFYPTKEARKSNLNHRPIGLGLMGYHDALFKLGIPYSSDRQVEFADESMELIAYHAILASSKLAKEKSSYLSFKGSKWDKGILPYDTLALLEENRGAKLKVDKSIRLDWDKVKEHIKKYGMRNSNCMAIAPTATIANITGVTPCVEPLYKNIYMKENLSGNFFIINRYLIDKLERLDLWNRDTIDLIKLNNGSVADVASIPEKIKLEFKEVHEIEQEWIIKAAACRSKWIDQSASTNLFLDTTRGKRVDEIYQLVWESGLKTTYYLRTIAASQVTKTVGINKENLEKKSNQAKSSAGLCH